MNVDETTHAFSPKVLDRTFTIEFTDVSFNAYPSGETSDAFYSSHHDRQSLLESFTRRRGFHGINKGTIAEYIAEHEDVRTRLQRLNELLTRYNVHFGYRVFDEIVTFLDAAEENETFRDIDDGDSALDAAVLMKVLPKFHGSRGKLEDVLAWCANPDAPNVQGIRKSLADVEDGYNLVAKLDVSSNPCRRTAERVLRLLQSLYTDGFATFG